MNLPNTITIGRFVLTIIFLFAASLHSFTGNLVALSCFILAAISDFLDGYLARKLNLITAFGKLMDPLADKVLVAAAFVHLTSIGLCPAWVTSLILAREFLVTGLRQIAVEQGQVIPADNLGKWKTTFQIAYCLIALLSLVIEPDLKLFQQLTLWPAFGLTMLSGLNYTLKSRSLFSEKSS